MYLFLSYLSMLGGATQMRLNVGNAMEMHLDFTPLVYGTHSLVGG